MPNADLFVGKKNNNKNNERERGIVVGSHETVGRLSNSFSTFQDSFDIINIDTTAIDCL